jgi:predicted phage terminase large subunit-like protein
MAEVRLAPGASKMEKLASQSREFRKEMIGSMSRAELRSWDELWDWHARDAQRAPEGNWRTWLILAGRGFGKTRAGAEWVRGKAERNGRLRIALVGATIAEARAVMVEGVSGLLTIAPPRNRPTFEPSLKRLTWRNGAQAFLYSAAEPEGLRGAEHHLAWADEIAKWPNGLETWDNLAMGLRLGARPLTVATTTPRPVPLVRRLLGEAGVAVTRGRMADNAAHLPQEFLAAMQENYAGTRIGRQELDGELIEEIEGALWTRAMIEERRVRSAPELRRVVVAVDPPAGREGDACGIVVVGLGADGAAYVIEDATALRMGPEGWARAVTAAAERHQADRVIAEANNGGAMVESVLRAVQAALPLRLVHASRGKVARAEPVAALYEAGKAFHAGGFPELEDQLCGMIAGGSYEGPGRSPDRADALVWAMSELMLGKKGKPGVRVV